MIELHLRGRAASGRRDDLIALLAEAIPFYEAPEGIRVRLMWDIGDPDRFVEVVEYADRATHDRDQERVRQDAQMADYLSRWRALLEDPPEVAAYEVDTPRP